MDVSSINSPMKIQTLPLSIFTTCVYSEHRVTTSTYFSNFHVECENENEISVDLRQEQGSPPRKDNSMLALK